MKQKLTRKELSILLAAIPALILGDLILMEQQTSRQERILALVQEGFEQGSFCADEKNRLGCVADTLSKYPLKMGASLAIESSFRKLRADGLSRLQDPMDRRRWEDEYHLALCKVLTTILKRVSEDDFIRPTDIYARRNFMKYVNAEVGELESWIKKIKKSYEGVGASLDPYHLDLAAALDKLRQTASNELSRSEITNFMDGLIP